MKNHMESLRKHPDAAADAVDRRILQCPNIVALCIDFYTAERQSGRLYHTYMREPFRFQSLLAALGQMDTFYDEIQVPFASVKIRSFCRYRGAVQKEPNVLELPEYRRKDGETMGTFDDVVQQRGTDATFLIRVYHRQHASWQGEVTWVDEQKKEYFRSALELVRLIDGALDGTKEVSE